MLIFATVLPIVLVLVIIVVLFFFLYFCRERFERKSRLSITSSMGLTSAAAATELFFRRDSGPLWINPEPSDDWEIDPKFLRLNKILQEGEHGIVLKGQLTTRRLSVRLTKRQGSILRDVTVACKIPKGKRIDGLVQSLRPLICLQLMDLANRGIFSRKSN